MIILYIKIIFDFYFFVNNKDHRKSINRTLSAFLYVYSKYLIFSIKNRNSNHYLRFLEYIKLYAASLKPYYFKEKKNIIFVIFFCLKK